MLLAGLTGCSKEETPVVEQPEIEVDETKEADIVIVGAGGAGLSAAIEATTDGAESVIVIEKTAKTGGSLNFTSGSMSGAETVIQEVDGIEDTKESFIEDIMTNGDHKGNKELIEAFVEEDQATMNWLYENGLKERLVPDRATGKFNAFAPEHRLYSIPRTVKPKPVDGEHYKAAAHEILDGMAFNEPKIQFDYNTEATQLLANEKGQVLSVIAEADGKTIRYNASKAVIMATGGFSGNSKMMGEYAKYGSEYLAGGASTADGYGIYMMQEIGANIAEESLSYIPTFPMGLEYQEGLGRIAPSYMWKYGGICVNQEGKRFVDETSDSVETRETTLEEQTNAIQYDIFTDKIIEDCENSEVMNVFWNFMYAPGKKLSQYVISAPTLEELAEKIGVPADALQETVDAYNASVDAKETDEFGRAYTEESLNPAYNVCVNKIDEGGNYYAIPLKALCVMTLGGVDINTNGQVLDTEGNIIPGLYAAGECTNVWGRFVSGGTGVMGPIVFGRLAARHAMAAESLEEGYQLKESLGLIDPALFEKESDLPTFDMSTPLTDGEYETEVDGQDGVMKVKTTITDGKISNVEILEQHESEFTTEAQEQIPAKIVETNSLDVDAVSGATLTSTRILTAVKNCLEEASK